MIARIGGVISHNEGVIAHNGGEIAHTTKVVALASISWRYFRRCTDWRLHPPSPLSRKPAWKFVLGGVFVILRVAGTRQGGIFSSIPEATLTLESVEGKESRAEGKSFDVPVRLVFFARVCDVQG